MPKNIVVLSDGTGQEGGKGHDSSVYKLLRMLEDRTDDQVVFYDEGVGSDWRKATGNIGGAGFAENILQCYQFIFETYKTGDRIFLLGFSRGAATVRSLANFIHFFGILPKFRPELIKSAYDLYKMGSEKKNDKEKRHAKKQSYDNLATRGMQTLRDLGDTILRGTSLNKKAAKFVHEYPNQWAKIEFLGVWDTVPALGLPGAVIDTFVNIVPGWKHRYHDFSLHPSVKNAYHALSIDDERKWFHPTIWDAYDTEKQKVEQVWFSGSHTDIGGGFEEPGLSDIVLEWMTQKAVEHGLKLYLKSKKYWNFCVAPDPTDKLHPSRKGFQRIFPKKQRIWPKSAQKAFGDPTIHESVIERSKQVEDYDPWIVKKFPDHKIEPWVEKFSYAKKKISIRDYDEASWKKKFKIQGDDIKVVKKEQRENRLLERGKWSGNRLKRDLNRWRKNT